jgi:hypothetical protein
VHMERAIAIVLPALAEATPTRITMIIDFIE